jgi:protein SCO1/2
MRVCFTHTLHTAMIERKGNLAANLEGNKFTAVQLGDLVQTVIGRRVGLIGWR